MEQFIQNLRTPYFWLSVVIVGLLINIISNYVMRWLDRFFPKLRGRFGSWVQKTESEFTQDIERSANDLQMLTFLAARQSAVHVSAIHYYVLSALTFSLGVKLSGSPYLSTVFEIVAMLLGMAGARDYGLAMRSKFILDNALAQMKKVVKNTSAATQQPP